jgi:hypothetical protein
MPAAIIIAIGGLAKLQHQQHIQQESTTSSSTQEGGLVQSLLGSTT